MTALQAVPGLDGSGFDAQELLAQTSEGLRWPHKLPAPETLDLELACRGPGTKGSSGLN